MCLRSNFNFFNPKIFFAVVLHQVCSLMQSNTDIMLDIFLSGDVNSATSRPVPEIMIDLSRDYQLNFFFVKVNLHV